MIDLTSIRDLRDILWDTSRPVVERMEILEQSQNAFATLYPELENPFYHGMPMGGAPINRAPINGREMRIFATYDYLGLSTHPKLRERAIAALYKYGVGPGGVRVLAGTTDLHVDLESKLAQWKGTEAAITFSSGFTANLSALTTLCGPDDTIVLDHDVHASIVDGARFSGAALRSYRHNNLNHLERILKSLNRDRKPLQQIFLPIDAVYSMNGDLAPLHDLVSLSQQYDAKIFLDEAHALGVLGPQGQGLAAHLGITDPIEYQIGTLSKALPGVGGFIAGSYKVINYLRKMSRPFIFSGALPAMMCASALAAIEVLETEPEHQSRMWRNQQLWNRGLQSLGFNTLGTVTPIVPVLTGTFETTVAFNRDLFEAGLFVSPIFFPTVPRDASRLRTCATAAHTEQDIHEALEIMGQVAASYKDALPMNMETPGKN